MRQISIKDFARAARVSQPAVSPAMGRIATEILLKIQDDPKYHAKIKMKGELIVRGSMAPPLKVSSWCYA